MYTIVITGGHHNSALAVAHALVALGHKVIWIGHRHASRSDQSDSAEYQEVTSAGIKFYDLPAGKMVFSLSEIIKIPWGIFRASQLLGEIKPNAVLSFGGYLGGTVSFSAWLKRIPVFLHEQTVTAGRANKLIGHIAQRIYLTWPDSAIHFPKSKTLVVGLPLRTTLSKSATKPIFSRKKPFLFVMGGKQGAHLLNQFIFSHLPDLLTNFNLVHQTGSNSVTGDLDMAKKVRRSLGSLADSYLPISYIDEHSIGKYFSQADYYFGRSGAHIVYELAVLKIPSILVPLMTTHDSEQWKNSQILVKADLARVILPSDLTLSKFNTEFASLRKSHPTPLQLPLNATAKLIDSLLLELK